MRCGNDGQRGSTLVIVLWIAFGLVSLTLYFAQSTSSELRASDNRVCGMAAEHAIEGAARVAAVGGVQSRLGAAEMVAYEGMQAMPPKAGEKNEGARTSAYI